MSDYERLPIRCDMSFVALQEAALGIGPAFQYDLHVSIEYQLSANALVKALGADLLHHPLAPCVNVCPDTDLSGPAWYLAANGKKVGSRGVQ